MVLEPEHKLAVVVVLLGILVAFVVSGITNNSNLGIAACLFFFAVPFLVLGMILVIPAVKGHYFEWLMGVPFYIGLFLAGLGLISIFLLPNIQS